MKIRRIIEDDLENGFLETLNQLSPTGDLVCLLLGCIPRTVQRAPANPSTVGVSPEHRVVEGVRIKINRCSKTQRILTDESPDALVEVPASVLIDSGLRIELTSGVLKGIGERPRRSRELAERVVGICVGESSSAGAKRCA